MNDLILGIDIGTSACKIVCFHPNGSAAAQCNKEYPIYTPQKGWVEQNPDEWWHAVCAGIREMLERSRINISSIACIGIDGQGWSAIPIDQAGHVLCKTPIWMDTRAADICNELNHVIGQKRIFEVCGNSLQPMYTLPKIIWYQRNRPEVFRKTYKILQSNSFIVYRLTGMLTSDLSQGYGLHCFDMRKGCYDTDMCRDIGVRKDLLPDLYPCSQVVGQVTRQAAEMTGLLQGIPVVAGGLDAACGTLGAGVIQDGEVQEQGGQAGGMSICMSQYKALPELVLGFHVIPGKWLLQGGTVGGGGVVKWFEKELGAEERILAMRNGTHAYEEMDLAAQKIIPGSDGLIFLPYMAGERSPIWDSQAKGLFYGLDFTKTRAHMIRAVLEGVAYSLRHNLETAERAGVTVQTMNSVGGAAGSLLWTQIKSDVTGKPIAVPESDTATALGAAMLAGVGNGIYGNFSEAVQKTVKVKRQHTPDFRYQEQYDTAFHTYIELYKSLKDIMHSSYKIQRGDNDR